MPIRQSQVASTSIQEIDPDIIVFDDAEAETFRTATHSILFCPSPLRVNKMIALGPGYLITVDCRKDVVSDANMGDLIARAKQMPIARGREVVETGHIREVNHTAAG